MKDEELLRVRVKQDVERARYLDLYDLAPAAYCSISAEGLVEEANVAAAELLGVTKSELIKQPFSHFILPADRELFKNRYCAQLLQTDAIVTFELWMMKKNGTVFRAKLKTNHSRGADGETAYRVVMSDISERIQDKLRLEEQLRFERLLVEISARLVNLPSNQIAGALKEAQRLVCECLDLDISAIWLWSTTTPRVATLAYLYRPLGGPPAPDPMSADEYYPWCRDQLEANRIVVIPSTEDVPAEAARDRESWRRFGIKSLLSFPLSPGGGPPIGTISFNATRKERIWR